MVKATKTIGLLPALLRLNPHPKRADHISCGTRTRSTM